MTLAEIVRRALATAVQSATAVLLAAGSGLVDIDVLEGAAVAALAGIVTVAHRASARWLESHPE